MFNNITINYFVLINYLQLLTLETEWSNGSLGEEK